MLLLAGAPAGPHLTLIPAPQPGPLVDSGSFLSSLAAARRDSESTDTEPEGDSSFARSPTEKKNNKQKLP